MNSLIRKRLEELSEPDYQKFAESLIPGLKPGFLLGVRLPRLRRLAKEIAGKNPEAFLSHAEDSSFEEIMLQGMVIGLLPGTPEEIFPFVEAFLPKIDNWSVCDSFCSGLKIAKKYPEAMWDFLQPMFQDSREYYLRFALVMLTIYFVNRTYLEKIFSLISELSSDYYYVKMAAAWAISICCREFPEETINYLKQAPLDDFTYQKSLQKILESRKISPVIRNQIRGMKRKG